MASNTVFISSTYKDLLDHRRAVWEVLQQFDVAVRGMEQFGARPEGPLDTCLAEVEQSDVYVGILAFRLGSVDQQSRKSFTQLEYEHAVRLGKDVLIYIADEEKAVVPAIHFESDARARRRLAAFKEKLRENHTVDTFSTPDDLAEKLRRDFQRYFALIQRAADANAQTDDEFAKTERSLREFRLTPKRLNGQEVRLSVAFVGSLFPASRLLCQKFNLEYGSTLGCGVRITKPEDRTLTDGLTELYAAEKRVDTLRRMQAEKNGEIYVLLQFCEDDVRHTRAEFFSRTYWDDPSMYEPENPYEVFVPAEGKVILLLSKPAEKVD